VDKSGTWLSYGETKLGQGRDAAKQFLKDHPEMAKEIEKKIKEKTGLLPMPAAVPEGKDKPEAKKEAEKSKEAEKAKEAEKQKVAVRK
jgi:recombination protein RecA